MANTSPKPGGETADAATIVTAGDTGNATPAPAGTLVGDDVKANELDGNRPPMKELTGIKYSGAADHRELSVQDLARIGAKDIQTALVWNKDNDFIVPITDVNASTLDAVIALPGFTAV